MSSLSTSSPTRAWLTFAAALVLAVLCAPAAALASAGSAPTIEGYFSSDLTATGATLHARISPGGLETSYHFEYGTTTAYEHALAGQIAEGLAQSHSVEANLSDLTAGAVYHFRVVAENEAGTTASEDQTFEFFPPACPNAAVRQQTGADRLPDCRAYELVSPSNANGTLLFSGGPSTGLATAPSRFAFVGSFNSLLGEDGQPLDTINTAGDLYVATRTDTGWVSHYVGLSGSQSGCMGGPPIDPRNRNSGPSVIQSSVLADPGMSRFLDFLDGVSADCLSSGNGTGDANTKVAQASNAPYLWSADGALLAHLPTDFGAVPGALEALKCPYETSGSRYVEEHYAEAVDPICSGETTASGDLTHLVFSSRQLNFAEPAAPEGQGLTVAPGSAYDDDLATGAVRLISLKPDGEDIPQDPSFASVPPQKSSEGEVDVPGGAEEFLRFPAVSTDGSRVLISTATAPTTQHCFESSNRSCPRFTDTPVHLYMRVADLATLDIAEDPTTHEPAPVHYLGMTPSGSDVYFTTEEQLLPEDEDSSVDLYMWSAAKAEAGEQPLTLISNGAAGRGNADDSCHPALLGGVPWTERCDAVPISFRSYSKNVGNRGGNGLSDGFIAQNGDIYFYSPELLDGSKGLEGQVNLYDYREGAPRYVTTFAPAPTCLKYQLAEEHNGLAGFCSEGPIARMQVSPDDSHMALVTSDRLGPYDNAGYAEMYSYTPATATLVCDSCNPDGLPATSGVEGSQDGLFMTDDGRTFFSTEEALVPSDTDESIDVYEFTEGHPQLITPGTGTVVLRSSGLAGLLEHPGLIGVSANGADVYFSTYDGLVSEDHNGDFLRFYDARTDGGFPQPTTNQPCEAAEECHGPGTEPPQLPSQGTAAPLAGGNATPESHPKHHRKAKRKRHKRRGKSHHRRANADPRATR